MDAVFKALADPTRRAMLDLLRERNGLTQGALEDAFAPTMTRFGVMKHLRVLEECGLVTSVKTGRVRSLYLNPVPVQEIADRWIASFAQPLALGLTRLRKVLEGDESMQREAAAPRQVYVQIIRTTPEKLWAAITDGALTPGYYYGGRLETDLKVGGPFRYHAPPGMEAPGGIMCEGAVVEVVPGKKLVHSFKGVWHPDMSGDPPSRITYEILPLGENCRLTVTHDGFPAENATFAMTAGGWPGILSGLKTLLETGKPLGYSPMADPMAA